MVKINNSNLNKQININLVIDNIDDLFNDENISKLFYIDNISRIMFKYNYKVTSEIFIKNNDNNELNNDIENIYILNNEYEEIIKKFDKYRIKINKISNIKNLDDNNIIELIVNKIKYSRNCIIKDDKIFIKLKNEEIEVIDDEGNYTDIIKLVAFFYELNRKKYYQIININEDININIIKEIIKSIDGDEVKLIKPNLNIPIYENIDISKLTINEVRYIYCNKYIDKNIHNDIELALKQPLYNIEKTINKLNKTIKDNDCYNNGNINDLDEDLIIKKLNESKIIMENSLNNYDPYIITKYMDELSSIINKYLDNKIVNENIINIYQKSKIILEKSLNLIGIITEF